MILKAHLCLYTVIQSNCANYSTKIHLFVQSTKFDEKALTLDIRYVIFVITKNTNVKNGTVKENEP